MSKRIYEFWNIDPKAPRKKLTTFGKPPTSIPVSRDELPALFQALEFKRGVEVGVHEGEYSEKLCCGVPGLKLIAVDPWTTYKGYREGSDPEKANASYRKAKQRLSQFDCELVRKTSVDAAKDHEDGSLDFVYIDGNHSLPYVIADLAAWSGKVRKGGIVSGHDYTRLKWRENHPKMPYCNSHVVPAVLAWTESYDIDPWFVLRKDKPPTWLWVKQ